jgi:signal peptidase I
MFLILLLVVLIKYNNRKNVVKEKDIKLYETISTLVTKIPKEKYTKTVRGLKYDNIEFIFSTDKLAEDNCVLVMGKKENFIRSPLIRQKLLNIYYGA